MLRYFDFSELVNILSEGFFADKVVDVLSKRKPLNETDQEVLKRILSFVDSIHAGKKQVTTGKLDGKAVKSIEAYYRAMVVTEALYEKSKEDVKEFFDKIIEQIKKETLTALEKREINPINVKTTREFFKLIQRETLKESSRFLESEIEGIEWPKEMF